ncbi:hypothetical protein PDE_01881 [Penicillium oxalicum 114-2]|uniref:Uncharacterized protein n=1 Tax=Penicillium oxalicum (strain 114-2 / CGMCC 5302) TaxID=933388 RepID=S7ZE30_PENO1|nr:hypothetical protein PDE_01881 [Penicillium oxalicum 114-2]
MKLHAEEDVVANQRGIDFFRKLQETREALEKALKRLDEATMRMDANTTRLQRRSLQERRRIISTFVRDSKLPRNPAARRMFLNVPENEEMKATMEMIRDLNQKTHGGDIHEDAKMALAFFEPSHEVYKAIETLYQMKPQEIVRLGKHEYPFKGLCRDPQLTRNE